LLVSEGCHQIGHSVRSSDKERRRRRRWRGRGEEMHSLWRCRGAAAESASRSQRTRSSSRSLGNEERWQLVRRPQLDRGDTQLIPRKPDRSSPSERERQRGGEKENLEVILSEHFDEDQQSFAGHVHRLHSLVVEDLFFNVSSIGILAIS
jgi:hypothetical protein